MMGGLKRPNLKIGGPISQKNENRGTKNAIKPKFFINPYLRIIEITYF